MYRDRESVVPMGTHSQTSNDVMFNSYKLSKIFARAFGARTKTHLVQHVGKNRNFGLHLRFDEIRSKSKLFLLI